MKQFLIFLLLTLSSFADSIPHILKGYESSDKLVIVVPDNDEEMHSLAMTLARKVSTVYPEDYVKEESYVDRFKLNYYANYAVIVLGKLSDFKLMKDHKFFPWRSIEQGFYSVDYGFVKSGFSFIYSGDNPYSLAKDLLATKNGQVGSPPFILLSGDSVPAVEKSAELFFSQNILSALVPVQQNLEAQFSRLKANQLVAQIPQKQSVPAQITIPQSFRFSGLRQGSLADYEHIYQVTKLLAKQIVQHKYLPENVEKYSKSTSLYSEDNSIKEIVFDYEQQAIAAYKKLKNAKSYQSYRRGNKVYLYRFRP